VRVFRRSPIIVRAIFLLLLLKVAFVQAQSLDSGPEENASRTEKKSINTGLPGFREVSLKSLTTPEQSLTYFVKKARQNEFGQAAYVLNLSHIAPENQLSHGAKLARKLYSVLGRKVGFPFDTLPDRRDGLTPAAPGSGSNSDSSNERRAFLLGTLPLEVGQFEVYLCRYSTEDSDSVWLFAPVTVEEIDEAYTVAGPRKWEQHMPEWLKWKFGDTPAWAWILLVLSMFAGAIGSGGLLKLLGKTLDWDLVRKLRNPVILFSACWLPYFVLGFWAPIPDFVRYLLLLGGLCALVGALSTVLHYFSVRLIRTDLESVEDLDQASMRDEKKTLTYLSLGRRVLGFLLFAVGIGVVTLKIPNFESVGMGLLASAGVLSVLLGVAAQPIVGNLMAGIQIGVSRPVRIGDSIIYEGTWCYVEDITFMYVMCRTWDEMRLVIPLKYFTSHPFRSDSLSDPRAMRTVEMKLDFTVDVSGLRKVYERMVEKAEEWDPDHEPELEVISFNEETITIRATAWSQNASSAWKLHCQIREHLLDYLKREQPHESAWWRRAKATRISVRVSCLPTRLVQTE
jgi:small-conductance mechanosensitive channel